MMVETNTKLFKIEIKSDKEEILKDIKKLTEKEFKIFSEGDSLCLEFRGKLKIDLIRETKTILFQSA